MNLKVLHEIKTDLFGIPCEGCFNCKRGEYATQEARDIARAGGTPYRVCSDGNREVKLAGYVEVQPEFDDNSLFYFISSGLGGFDTRRGFSPQELVSHVVKLYKRKELPEALMLSGSNPTGLREVRKDG